MTPPSRTHGAGVTTKWCESVSAKLVTEKHRLVTAILLLAIFMVGMALRLHDLDLDSLWADEIWTATRAQRDVLSIVARIASGEDKAVHPPLMFIVTHFFIVLFGETEFILRLQAMLFGSLSVLLVYKVGEILWTRKEGVIGAFLLAMNAYHVEYSQEARHYALMVSLALLSLIFLLKALKGNRKRLWLGFVLCTSLGLYNHVFALLILPAEVAFAAWVVADEWLLHKRRQGHASCVSFNKTLPAPVSKAFMLLASLGLVGALYVPWLPALQGLISREVGSQGVGVSPASLQAALDFLGGVISNYSGAHRASIVLWVGLFMLGLATTGWKRRVLTLLWIGTPFVFLSIVAPQHDLRGRYVLFILPVYLVVIARGTAFATRFLGRLLQSIKGDVKWDLVLTPLVVMLLGLLGIAPLRDYYHSQKDDWRSALAYVRENMAENDIIIADGEAYHKFADARRVVQGLTYYSSVHNDDLYVFHARRDLVDRMRGLADLEGSAWGVLWHARDLANLERVTGDVRVVEFYRVAVVRLLDPAGDLLQDTRSLLETLVLVQPRPEGRFDLHLALAEIHLRTGRFEEAALELDIASRVKPDHPRAWQELDLTRAELEQVSYATVEDIGRPLWRSVGLELALLGYDVQPTSLTVGRSLDVSLWWEALAKMDRDYSAFIHVVGPDDRMWGQRDTVLQHGGYGTSTWEIGDVVKGEYEVELAPDTPAGDYLVKAGVYFWETGERLPVWDESGERLARDAISLGSIRITK